MAPGAPLTGRERLAAALECTDRLLIRTGLGAHPLLGLGEQ